MPSVPPPVPNAAPPEGSARPVGLASRFTILSQHAQGGRGRVFLARDEQLGRIVALKDIRPEVADQGGVRDRFVAEAEITGRLEHPGTVPVYALEKDAAEGPVYAMRFVQGQTLGDATRAAHAGGGPPRLRELLGRFAAVCRTVAYAHAKGVVHRDLKPANIQLGDFGETLVLDWGLAKRVGDRTPGATLAGGAGNAGNGETVDFVAAAHGGDTGQGTSDGQVLGSPPYMAPEQARGEGAAVGPAADVYGLGAILYECLTGRAPYQGRGAAQVIAQVVAGPPPAPTAVAANVPRALDAVCRKAMARAPADRYSTALALADDVDRWLADEPVSAWREPLVVRTRRWAGRHRSGVAAAAAAVVMAGVSLGIATALLAAANARERAAKEEAREQRDRAGQNYRLARRAVDRYHTEVSEDVILHEPGMEPLRRRLLEAAREFYAQFAEQQADDPEVKAEHGRSLYRLAQITADVDDPARGVELHQQAAGIFAELARARPDDAGLLAEQASCLHNLGRLQVDLDHLGKARTNYENALAVWVRLREALPDEPRYRNDEARSRHGLGNLELVLRREEAAREHFTKALEIRKQLAAAHPVRDDFARDLAVTRHNLAMVQTSAGPADQALDNFKLALAAQEKLAKSNPKATQYAADVARTHLNLGTLHRQRGRLADAAAEFETAAADWGRLADEHPTVWRFRLTQAQAFADVCSTHQANRRDAAADGAATKAQEIYKQMVQNSALTPRDWKEIGVGYRRVGDLHRSSGQLDKARGVYEQALRIVEPLALHPGLPEYKAEAARIWNNLGLLARQERNAVLAEVAFSKARGIWENLLAEYPKNGDYAFGTAVTWRNLADLRWDAGNLQEAVELFGQAITATEVARTQWGDSPAARSIARAAGEGRARALGDLGRHADALSDWNRVAEMSEGPQLLWARVERAVTLARLGEHARAIPETDALATLLGANAEGIYRLACAYALSAEAVARDESIAPGERATLANGHAAKAIVLLKRVAGFGYFQVPANREKLEKSPDLNGIRGRADLDLGRILRPGD